MAGGVFRRRPVRGQFRRRWIPTKPAGVPVAAGKYGSGKYGTGSYGNLTGVTTGPGVNQTSETDVAQPITAVKGAPTTGVQRYGSSGTKYGQAAGKYGSLGGLSSTTLATPVETDLAQPLTKRKRKTLGQPSATNFALTLVRPRTIGQVTQTNTAQAVNPKRGLKIVVLQAVEEDDAYALAFGELVPTSTIGPVKTLVVAGSVRSTNTAAVQVTVTTTAAVSTYSTKVVRWRT